MEHPWHPLEASPVLGDLNALSLARPQVHAQHLGAVAFLNAYSKQVVDVGLSNVKLRQSNESGMEISH